MLDIEKLKELEAKATKGPWTDNGVLMGGDRGQVLASMDEKSIRFIVTLRNALPSLIQEIEQARAFRDAVEKMDCADLQPNDEPEGNRYQQGNDWANCLWRSLRNTALKIWPKE